MLKSNLIFILALLSTLVSDSLANAEITWLEKEYDFGLMKEEAGKKTGYARFVNNGPDTVCITGVKPSCGCTSADYTDTPLAPGDTATVSFTYDPKGRPGRFNKSVRVYVGNTDTYRIAIKGNVLGTPESLAALYPVESGPLRLSTALLTGGEIKKNSSRHFFVNGYNQQSDTIHPKIVCREKALSVEASSDSVGPGDIVTYSFYLTARQLPDSGFINIPVRIYPNPEDESQYAEVHLTADITNIEQ